MSRLLCCFSLLLFSVGCTAKQSSVESLGALPQTGEAVAMVNGVPITQDSIDWLVSYIAESEEEREAIQRRLPDLVEQMVLTELIYQKALADNVQQDPDHQFLLALAIRTTLSEIYIKERMDELLSDERLREEYQARLDSYRRVQCDMSMILVEDAELADAIVEQAKAGSDFAQLVLEHSLDEQSKADNGRLPTLYLEELPPVFRNALSEASAGDVIGPLSFGNSLGILKVSSLNPVVIPFEDVKVALQQELADGAENTITEELKAEAAIEYMIEK